MAWFELSRKDLECAAGWIKIQLYESGQSFLTFRSARCSCRTTEPPATVSFVMPLTLLTEPERKIALQNCGFAIAIEPRTPLQ